MILLVAPESGTAGHDYACRAIGDSSGSTIAVLSASVSVIPGLIASFLSPLSRSPIGNTQRDPIVLTNLFIAIYCMCVCVHSFSVFSVPIGTAFIDLY